MSEELIQRKLTEHGTNFGPYEFYSIGGVTLTQLKSHNIVPSKEYEQYGSRKPDFLLVDRRNKKDIRVIICGESKQPEDFLTEAQKKIAIESCNDIAQETNASIGLATDWSTFVWFNPWQITSSNNYTDKTTGKIRSYTIITGEDGIPFNEHFDLEDEENVIFYIMRLLESLNSSNSILAALPEIDPLPLAKNVWQDIYINTGKSPTKCLYNVVELFIFKFLSDLQVLKAPYDFQTLEEMIAKKTPDEDILKQYANLSRKKIKELFKPGPDGTSIINGTIFVRPNGEPVLSQATLFVDSLKKYSAFGTLKNIRKDFKTKLFETFLKQSKDKSKLGQFLTPRKVVKAIVNMAGVDKLPENTKICDPFCGVGGFIAETIQNPIRKRDFVPNGNKISAKIIYKGYDKSTDEEEERTIILAKANFLIYLSDIVEKNPTLTDEFSRVINDIFNLFQDENLGTFKNIILNEKDKFDLILTNPPYITKGVQSIKNDLARQGLKKYYTANGKGTDALAVEWIVRSLAKNGRAFIILRDGLLNVKQNSNLRSLLLKQCYLNCVISLPVGTFFNTPQKTYIIGITKKNNEGDKQEFPVFTYLVSTIGETLNAYRFETGISDLDSCVNLFNLYKGSPDGFSKINVTDPRCKVQPIDKFVISDDWIIDKWWNNEELVSLGIQDRKNTIDVPTYLEKINDVQKKIVEIKQKLQNLESVPISPPEKFVEISIPEIFDISLGRSKYDRKYMRLHKGPYPVYSSQTLNDGIIGSIDTYDHDIECLTWTVDGYAGNVFHRNGKFNVTVHCGILKFKPVYRDKLDYSYLRYILNEELPSHAVGVANKRLKIHHISRVSVKLPVDKTGSIDLNYQKQMAVKFNELKNTKQVLEEELKKLLNYYPVP